MTGTFYSLTNDFLNLYLALVNYNAIFIAIYSGNMTQSKKNLLNQNTIPAKFNDLVNSAEVVG